jgi:hypothetical protein
MIVKAVAYLKSCVNENVTRHVIIIEIILHKITFIRVNFEMCSPFE